MKNNRALCRELLQTDGHRKLALTCLEGEVVHHLQSSHHQQVWLELFKFAGEVLHGGQVRVMVVTVDDVSAGHEETGQLSPKQHSPECKHGCARIHQYSICCKINPFQNKCQITG